MTRLELGQRIRALRLQRGWTQEQMGRLLTLPRTHAAVSDIERGKTGLDIEEMTTIAALLGTDLAGLLNIDSVPTFRCSHPTASIVAMRFPGKIPVCSECGQIAPDSSV